MFPNSYQKSQCTVATQDMPIKKKLLLYIALMCLVILWFLGVRNRGSVFYFKGYSLLVGLMCPHS